jgi:hypothetical protein
MAAFLYDFAGVPSPGRNSGPVPHGDRFTLSLVWKPGGIPHPWAGETAALEILASPEDEDALDTVPMTVGPAAGALTASWDVAVPRGLHHYRVRITFPSGGGVRTLLRGRFEVI